MGNTYSKYPKCDFCGTRPKNNNPYVFKIEGLGKHDGKVICGLCLEARLGKQYNTKNYSKKK